MTAITTLEPFVETSQPFEECRVGFRRYDGEIVSQIVVSADLLRKALRTDKSINLTLSIEGIICASMDEGADNAAPRSVCAIDDLLRTALINENLHLEEASVHELGMLLARLEDSVDMVRHAISQIAKSG